MAFHLPLPRPWGVVRPLTAAAAIALAVALSGCATRAPTLTADQVAALVADPERSEADRTNDQRRKPREMLLFIGVKPGMQALDLSAAGGYTTELLARAAGPSGRVYGQTPARRTNPPPAQPEGGAPMAAAATPRPPSAGLAGRAERLRSGHIVAVVLPFEQPFFGRLGLRRRGRRRGPFPHQAITTPECVVGFLGTHHGRGGGCHIGRRVRPGRVPLGGLRRGNKLLNPNSRVGSEFCPRARLDPR